MVWRAVTVSDRLRDLQLQPDPFGAVDEAQRDEGLGLVVGELVRPRHPAGIARARARALVLPVEHRPATEATATREHYFSSKKTLPYVEWSWACGPSRIPEKFR